MQNCPTFPNNIFFFTGLKYLQDILHIPRGVATL